jgi:acyl-[acyl-carrier-protein]-phospholipid O-acyltransferase/long-chain-fatty-acid--[acyl-carrier-protein] ligase
MEDQAASAWPEAAHAAVARPDPRKGEELVLFTTQLGATAAALLAWGRARGVAELALPRDVRVVEAIPTLATGKADYVTLNALAMASRLETA